MSVSTAVARLQQSLALTVPSRRDWLLAGLILLVAVLYLPLNHGFGHAHVLTTSVDADLPVVPIFAAPYVVFLPLFWATVLYAFASRRDFLPIALAVLAVYGVSDLVYLVYPTYVPRPHVVHGFLSGLVRYVYAHDNPYNDCPSEHVSSAALLALYAWRSNLWLRLGTRVLLLTIIAATLLIKQHSIIGAAAGLGLAMAVWLIVPQTRRRLFA